MITHVKTKSISKEQDPKEIFDSLSYRQIRIIDIAEKYRRKGLCWISQEELGRRLGVRRETINRDIAKLKALGLIEVQHRYNQSNLTSTSHWFRRPEVQNLLPLYFCNFQVVTLSLSLLASPDHTSIERFIYKSPSYPSLSYEGVNMGKEGRTDRKEIEKEERPPKQDEQVSVPEAGHIKKICQSLQRRGSTISNDEALKLLAYQPDVHERASERFKREAKGKIRDPFAFYLHLCRDIATNEGRKADWSRVEGLKGEGYVLLEETLQGMTQTSSTATQSGPQKREGHNPSYSEQVQQERKKMDEEAAARKTKKGPPAEEVLKWNQTVYELQQRVDKGDIAAQWTLPLAIGTLKHLISEYEVDPGNEAAMAYARAFTASQKAKAQPEVPAPTPAVSTEFKTPASCLSSLYPSVPLVKKSEPVTLKEDIWEGYKEYDPGLKEEEFNEEIYD